MSSPGDDTSRWRVPAGDPPVDAELLDVLFHRAPLGVAVYDRDLILRRFNDTFADLVDRHGSPQYTPLRPGRSLFDYFPSAEPRLRTVAAPVLAGDTRWYRGVPHELGGVRSYWDLLLVPLRRENEVVGVVQITTDATDRAKADERVAHNERRLRSILRNSSDITLVIDAARRLRYAAPSVRRLLDMPEPEVDASDVTDQVHPDDRAEAKRLLIRCAGTPGEGPVFRCRLQLKNRAWRMFEVVPVNLLDDPDVEGIVLTARDITDREEAKAELRRRDAILDAVRFAAQRFLESRSSWRANIYEVMEQLGRATTTSRVYIFENFHGADGSRWTSQSHEWVAAGIEPQINNPALAAISYHDSDFAEAAQQLGAGKVIAGNVSDLPEARRAVLEEQGIRSMVLVPVFVGGRWWGFIGFDECEHERTWSAAEIGALRAAASTLSAAVHRQRAEDQLREQQAQYRQVFDATGDGLVITDLDGRLVRANPAFYRMHGYQPEELIGRRAGTWIHPDFHQERSAYTDAILGGARPRSQELDVRKDGSTFPVQVQGSAFTFQGRPHVLGVVRDDTERTQAFELLEKRLTALSTIAASLTVNQALSDTLDVIVRAVVASTPAVAGSAYVLDRASGTFRIFATSGLPEGYMEAVEQGRKQRLNTVPREYSCSGPLIVRNAVQDGLENPEYTDLHPLLRQVEWDTVAIIPFESQQGRLGSVRAYYPRGTEPSADDLAFLKAVADQGSVAVVNTSLLAEAQSKASLEERQRLARELHDSVSQALYGIALGARTARTLAEHKPDQVAEPLDYVLALAEAGMTEMRSLIFELRPESLANEGLVAALEKRVAVLRARHQLEVTAQLGTEPSLSMDLKETLYRIAQEALHNTVKHAHAKQVRLRLSVAADEVQLDVSDDGVGFDTAASPPGHLGLQSMRERTGKHHGILTLSSTRGEGTTITVVLPVSR